MPKKISLLVALRIAPLCLATVMSFAVSPSFASGAPAAKEDKEGPKIPVVTSIPQDVVPESTVILDNMRERLVISQLSQTREAEEKERAARVRQELEKVIDFDAEAQKLNQTSAVDEAVTSSETSGVENKKSDQERIRDFQISVIKQALLRYQSEKDGIGQATSRDMTILSRLLCREDPAYRKMAAYRAVMLEQVGPGPLRAAVADICQR